MKIKKILNNIFLLISLFIVFGVCIADTGICTEEWWTVCLSWCWNDSICMEDCQTEYDNNCDENNQTQNPTISCDYYPNEYWDCDIYVWNYEYSDWCCVPVNLCINPPETWWICQEWFYNDGGCCQPMCSWSLYLPEGAMSMTECTWCAEWTVPNANHTKCICDSDYKCCGVQLNNTIPFIWDCIEMNAESSRDNTTNVNSVTAFPILMQWLMKILMSVIMIFSFIMIIVAWLLIVSGAFGWNWFTTGKKIIKNVIISLILLWSSWLILSLINPSFFGG